MTSRGVKCSPAVSFDSSANLRISFLEGEAHVVVVDRLGVQVDCGELLGHLVEQPGFGEGVDLGVELEPFEDVARFG